MARSALGDLGGPLKKAALRRTPPSIALRARATLPHWAGNSAAQRGAMRGRERPQIRTMTQSSSLESLSESLSESESESSISESR